MSTAPPIYGQFGQALAFAERSLTSVLSAHLAERNTEPETWYALQLIATRGPESRATSSPTSSKPRPTSTLTQPVRCSPVCRPTV